MTTPVETTKANVFERCFLSIALTINSYSEKLPSTKNLETQLLSNNESQPFIITVGELTVETITPMRPIPQEGMSIASMLTFDAKNKKYVCKIGGSKKGAGDYFRKIESGKLPPQVFCLLLGYMLTCQLSSGQRSFASAIRSGVLYRIFKILKSPVTLTIGLSDESEKRIFKHTLKDSEIRLLVDAWNWRASTLDSLETKESKSSKMTIGEMTKEEKDYLATLNLE